MISSDVTLRWQGEGLVFEGGVEGGPTMSLDSDGKAGPSPTQALLMSVAGCMGVDLVMILEKSRVPVRSLEVVISGDRAADAPRFFTGMRLTYRIDGPAEEDQGKLDRAVRLSRDKYCSVLHTLRPDLELDVRVERA